MAQGSPGSKHVMNSIVVVLTGKVGTGPPWKQARYEQHSRGSDRGIIAQGWPGSKHATNSIVVVLIGALLHRASLQANTP